MSGGSKKRRFLFPEGISELFWNSKSEDTEASSESMSEDEENFQDEPGVSHLQPDRPTSSGQAPSSSTSKRTSDGFQSGSGQQWTRPSDRCSTHLYRGPQGETKH